ncbi:hypothetical protein QP185_21080 [Sphingomonas aerolata]|uniref:hypothetical protein n=1 Tax=Sphingomonas aerolata TaxID=185951 RepID=UPI002FE17402
MGAASEGDDLIDVVVRLPRKAIEETLLSMPPDARDLSERRLAEARAVLVGRRRRSTHFNGVRFYDPSWDMILELYVATCERRRIAVSQLCKLSGGSTTTALRHIEHLEALGYIVRQTDPDDGRRLIVGTLTPFVLLRSSGSIFRSPSPKYRIGDQADDFYGLRSTPFFWSPVTYRTIEKVPFDLPLGQTAAANFEPELAGPRSHDCNFPATPIRR